MAFKAKSNDELAVIELRMKIIRQMEKCVKNNEVQKVSSYASALSMLPIYIDYLENE